MGHDLAQEGIVVEELSGLDNLPERLAYFSPSPQRRGVYWLIISSLVQKKLH